MRSAGGFAKGPARLARLVLLSTDTANCVTARRLRPAEALIGLVAFSFQLDIADRRRLDRTFDLLARLVAEVPVFELRYPRDFTRLQELQAVTHPLIS